LANRDFIVTKFLEKNIFFQLLLVLPKKSRNRKIFWVFKIFRKKSIIIHRGRNRTFPTCNLGTFSFLPARPSLEAFFLIDTFCPSTTFCTLATCLVVNDLIQRTKSCSTGQKRAAMTNRGKRPYKTRLLRIWKVLLDLELDVSCIV